MAFRTPTALNSTDLQCGQCVWNTACFSLISQTYRQTPVFAALPVPGKKLFRKGEPEFFALPPLP